MAVAAPDTALPHSAARSNVARAIKDAVFTALISFALFLPLIGFKTVQNMRNELELETRLPLLLTFVAIIVAAKLAHSLVIAPWLDHRARNPAPARAALTRAKRLFVTWFAPFGLGFVVVYPVLVLFLVGPQGALKWVD